MKYKLVIFDLDGVLVDSTRIVSSYFTQLRPELTAEVLSEMLCGNYHEELKKYEAAHGVIEETEEQERAYVIRKANSPLFDGIYDLLKTLKSSGQILTINTSAEPSNSLPALEKTGIINFFDTIATKEMSRSKVEKFKILVEKYKIPKKNIIFVTDTLGDLREADIAGIPTVAVTFGQHERKYFTREAHDNLVGIVDTVLELGKILMEE